MKYWTFVAGPIDTNAFLVADEATKDAVVIDAPPGVTTEIVDAVQREGLKVSLIVLTHAHWDHIIDAAELARTFKVPLAAHPDSLPQLAEPSGGGYNVPPISPDRLLEDGDTLQVGSLRFEVRHTPGHAAGQISLIELNERAMFGGDTLFPDGYGGIDGSPESIRTTAASMSRLLDLPDDLAVHPGHGLSTTIGRERPWMEEFVRAEHRPEE